MSSKVTRLFKRFKETFTQVDQIHGYLTNDLKSPKILSGQIMARLNREKNSIGSLQEVEFQVFSQWGDDGIIQYITDKIHFPNKTFVEFGVENYRESNTRFLLVNDKWQGLIIDGSKKNIEFVKKDPVYWASHLFAKEAFITKDNINELIHDSFLKYGYDREIGILSVDIDGNDYWIWQAINVVNPVMVIAEYNSLFGYNTRWTLPYKADFVRNQNGLPITYYGVSLGALCSLANEKGYVFVGCNSNGNNAYFIRKDKMNHHLKEKTVAEGYVFSVFREYSSGGERPSGADRMSVLKGLDVFDLDSGQLVKIDPDHIKFKS